MENTERTTRRTTPMELLSITGFVFLMGYMFVSFFWLFRDFENSQVDDAGVYMQMWLFVGMAIGYIALHYVGRLPRFNLFSNPVVAAEFVFCALVPIFALLGDAGVGIPLFLGFVVNAFAGIAYAGLMISWLDVSSRLRISQYGRFNGFAFTGGVLLFVLTAFAPDPMQEVLALAYLACSIGLNAFATNRADANDERAPLNSVETTWKFAKELEPSFFMFGVVFALTFAYLCNTGDTALFAGIIATVAGSLFVAILSIFHHEMVITSILRILTVISVIACVAVPFVNSWLKIALSCLTTAGWALFFCVNQSFIAKKAALARDVPCFRQAPRRLAVVTTGFALGWIVATAVTTTQGAHSDAFTVARLTIAVILVMAVMVFFPVEGHHEIDGTSPDISEINTTVINVQLSEQELFELRCEAVSNLYQLSGREAEVLQYLAKGRNAAYIQEKLTISPHTVKSHIYNIYRKTDIHSQQKLMDFVEEYSIENCNVPKKS